MTITTSSEMYILLLSLAAVGFSRISCTDETKNIAVAVCQSDYFRAKCAWNELIVIAHAQYGRMRINYKCVSENFGYVGCSDDVTGVVDRYCSGRRACHIRVLDETFPEAQPCHEDLNSYLEVEYQCIAALTAEHQACGPTVQPIKIADMAPSGGPVYIAAGGSWTSVIPPVSPSAMPSPPPPIHVGPAIPTSSSSSSGSLVTFVGSSSSCGHPSSPWLVAASPGQRIFVTAVDFDLVPQLPGGGANSGNGTTSSTTAAALIMSSATMDDARCSGRALYAVIGERGDITHNNITVCGGGHRRLTSSGSSTSVGEGVRRDGVRVDGRYELSTSGEKPVRERLVYESVGHVVEVVTPSSTPISAVAGSVGQVGVGNTSGRSTWHQHRQRRYGFVLRLEVVGCPDIEAPPGGWAFRNDKTTATFGCAEPMTSPKTWQLVCMGHSWRGIMYNCTLAFNVAEDVPTEEDIRGTVLSAGVLVLVAAGLAFALCLSVVVARHALDPTPVDCCFTDNDDRNQSVDKEPTSVSDSTNSGRHRRRRRRHDSHPGTGRSPVECHLPYSCEPTCTTVSVCGGGGIALGSPYCDVDVCGLAMTSSGRPMNVVREV